MARRTCWLWIIVLTALAVPANALAKETPKAKPGEKADEDYYELFEIFVDSLDQIERNYVREISRRELVEAAIEGMIDKLDTHSSYVGPKAVEKFRANVENKFGGIGIHVAIEKGQLTVVSPLVGAPAYREGMLAGDQIIEIEGDSTKGISLDEAVRRLKGKVGTEVTVTVRQGLKGKPREITVTRDIVRVETVLGDHRKEDDSWDYMFDADQRIGYVRINSFSRDTAADVREALEELKKLDMQGLILDLRFNPGGLLSSAIEISDLFVSKGKIVSTKGRNTKDRSWPAKADGTFEGFPIAVLINRFSASASEIVSACLQDSKRGVLVGERTYGKGSVQNVIELEDGRSVLKLTTASYWRPNGKNIHRFDDAKESDEWGVSPDDGYEIKLADDEMRDLMIHRRNQYVAKGKATEIAPEENPDETDKDETDEGDQESKSEQDEPDSDAKEPAEDKPSESDAEADSETDEDEAKEDFVDRQLQKAVEYLSSEIARLAVADAGDQVTDQP